MNKNQYSNKSAIVILGGTSIDAYIDKLSLTDKNKFVIFAETKCISKKLYDQKIIPDYFICPFSIKLKDNYYQNFIFRSLMCDIDIKKFVKKTYFDEVDYLKNNFKVFYEDWRPHKGIHKKFIFKKSVFLKNSPYDNLKLFPKSNLIIDEEDFKKNFDNFSYQNETIKIKFNNNNDKFNLNEYYNVKNKNGILNFKETNFLNSQSICHFPLLKFLGFKKIYFLGMDMNFFGSFEFDFREIFKSKFHLYLFIFLIRKTLNGNFKMNFPIYLRPKEEFLNLKSIIPDHNNYYRVITNEKSSNIPKINTIKLDDFLDILI
jgi:hypothetical protein